jgi:hypothetical protein
MTLLAGEKPTESSSAAVQPLTLWGYSTSALHDCYWLAREVAVVRCGSVDPLPSDARLFMLLSGTRLYRLHLRQVLDRMFWMPRSLYFLGFNPPAKSRPNHNGAASAAEHVAKRTALWVEHQEDRMPGPCCASAAARMVLTPHRDIAEYWRTMDKMDNIWMRLRRQFPDFGSMRIAGIQYSPCGPQAMEYLQGLARDWPDPETSIPGITRLARRVVGPTDFDMSTLKNHTRPLWIGLRNGVSADSTACILPDAIPAGDAAISNTRRNP